MRFHRARGLAKLKEVAFGSAMKSLWLRNGKVGSQISGIDQRHFPGEEQLGKLGEEEDKKEEPVIK